MKDLYKKSKDNLKKLQRAPDNVKKRWLVGSAIGFMILILGLWLVYINTTLPQLANSEAVTQQAPESQSSSKGFFKTLGLGIQNILNNLKNQWQNFGDTLNRYWDLFKNTLQKTNNFSFEGNAPNFTPKSEEPMPKVTLP